MKIVTIIGARPQFIKAGTVCREIAKHPGMDEVLVHTGQHYDSNMSDIFFREMKIPHPDHNLGIAGGFHGQMTGQMLIGIESILQDEKPDMVLVYGDTNSTLAGALAASKLHIPLAHVEAGLRSFNKRMPEEINRILTDKISDILFCPTTEAVTNLHAEGQQKNVIMCGDVMFDGALYYSEFARKPEMKDLDEYVLCTIHRAENTDDLIRLKGIVEGVNKLSKKVKIVLLLHPRTKARLAENDIRLAPGVDIQAPVGYLNMVWLIQNSRMVLTDSGGLQKEAYFFRKYCLTLRDETEWVELVKHKANFLVGASSEAILETYQSVDFANESVFEAPFYGDGHAARQIVAGMKEFSA